MIEVVKAGPLTTIQDRGRVGWAHLGIPRAGALDAPALARANALVGNDPEAAGLEITLTGCTLRLRTPAVVAVTGASAVVALDGEARPRNVAFPVRPSAVLTIGPATVGVRTYLAVRGGIDVRPVLGSRSRDTLAGIGPPPLRKGDTLPIGRLREPTRAQAASPGAQDQRNYAHDPRNYPEVAPSDPHDPRNYPEVAPSGTPIGGSGGDVMLRVRFGPRDDWFVAGARGVLLGSAYTMTISSNRVGARLAGEPLLRTDVAAELPSEGLVLGAVQVAPDGMPIVFLADHPTTGGYPVIAVVDANDIFRLAQVRPRASVRFRG